MFYYPISSPFAILHVDLWMSSHYTDSNGYIALMDVMCDMSKFVVVVPVPDESSDTLASYFMQRILLKFSLYHLVVLDDSTPFKGVFTIMCESLNLKHDVFVKRDHKVFTVDHFHRFLNKRITIAAEERGNNEIFVPTGVAAGSAWNNAPIDGTNIIRSMPAIGRELHFPLDINLNALPKLTQNNGQAALYYLKLTDSFRHFSSSIFRILIGDRRIVHINLLLQHIASFSSSIFLKILSSLADSLSK